MTYPHGSQTLCIRTIRKAQLIRPAQLAPRRRHLARALNAVPALDHGAHRYILSVVLLDRHLLGGELCGLDEDFVYGAPDVGLDVVVARGAVRWAGAVAEHGGLGDDDVVLFGCWGEVWEERLDGDEAVAGGREDRVVEGHRGWVVLCRHGVVPAVVGEGVVRGRVVDG